MSVQNIEKFYEIINSDEKLLDQLADGREERPEEIIERAVAAAGERGLHFTKDEALAWIAEQKQIQASGELTDTQLEAVAGGKGRKAKNTWKTIAEFAAGAALQ